MASDRRICVGMITGAHGVCGLVRLRSFTEDPYAIEAYKPLTDEGGERTFSIVLKNTMKDHFIASVKGIDSREKADALHGVKLYIERQVLPKAGKGEFYQADLIGLAVKDKSGKSFGAVLAFHDYGAGPFLEIGTSKKDSFMLPFTDACVPEVDLKAGSVVIAPPAGWLDKEEPPDV